MTIPLRLAASGAASLLTFGGVALLVAGDRSEAPAFAVAPAGARGAADLSLAPDLSFTDETVGAGARCASGAENF